MAVTVLQGLWQERKIQRENWDDGRCVLPFRKEKRSPFQSAGVLLYSHSGKMIMANSIGAWSWTPHTYPTAASKGATAGHPAQTEMAKVRGTDSNTLLDGRSGWLNCIKTTPVNTPSTGLVEQSGLRSLIATVTPLVMTQPQMDSSTSNGCNPRRSHVRRAPLILTSSQKHCPQKVSSDFIVLLWTYSI